MGKKRGSLRTVLVAVILVAVLVTALIISLFTIVNTIKTNDNQTGAYKGKITGGCGVTASV